jgi:hypothetical protein
MRRKIYESDLNVIPVQPPKIEHKKFFHPFAEKQSPFEEWKAAIFLALETIFQFITMDILGSILYYLWKCFEYLLLTPVAFLGLSFEYIRVAKGKVRNIDS